MLALRWSNALEDGGPTLTQRLVSAYIQGVAQHSWLVWFGPTSSANCTYGCAVKDIKTGDFGRLADCIDIKFSR